jgi:dTDP-4-dehydrorhamnose reductase
MNILVFGARGFLGTSICSSLENKGWRVFKQSRVIGADFVCDPTNLDAVRKILNKCTPEIVLNLNALADVDFCEKHQSEAYTANVDTVHVLSKVLLESDIKSHLIHISTDQVYNSPGPHSEKSVKPINVYGTTKFAGELEASKCGATILRTNFFGRDTHNNGRGFTDWLFHLLKKEESFTALDDVFFSPLHMSTIGELLILVADKKIPGIYNLGSREGFSKASFAKYFAEELELDISKMKIGSIRDLKLIAPRPSDMRMMLDKFELAFNMELPNLKSQIKIAADEYRVPNE